MKTKERRKKEKENIKKMIKNNRGITLIALVVTIVVLIILATVSVNAVFGQNGLISKAEQAKEEQRGAEVQDVVAIWKLDKELSGYIEGEGETKEELLTRLQNEGLITASEKAELEANGAVTIGSHTISFAKTLVEMFNDGELQIGDYVNYQNPTSGVKTILAEDSGMADAGKAVTDQTFDVSKNQLTWRVLGIDEETGGLKLIAGSPIKASNVIDYGYDTLNDEQYEQYKEYAIEILEGKKEEEIAQIFVDGQNFWNEHCGWGEPTYDNINALIADWSENSGRGPFTTIEGMCNAYGYDNISDIAIAWQYVEPKQYYDVVKNDPYFYMYGAKGYINAERNLNEICSMYKNDLAVKARSVTVEDINAVTGAVGDVLDSVNQWTGDGSTYGYGKPYSFTNKYTPESYLNGETTTFSDIDDAYYYYAGAEGLTTATDTKLFDLLFKNVEYNISGKTAGACYWLASRCVLADSNRAEFNVREVHSGGSGAYVGGSWLFFSDGYENNDGLAVRPVVILRSDVTGNDIQKTDQTEIEATWNYTKTVRPTPPG